MCFSWLPLLSNWNKLLDLDSGVIFISWNVVTFHENIFSFHSVDEIFSNNTDHIVSPISNDTTSQYPSLPLSQPYIPLAPDLDSRSFAPVSDTSTSTSTSPFHLLTQTTPLHILPLPRLLLNLVFSLVLFKPENLQEPDCHVPCPYLLLSSLSSYKMLTRWGYNTSFPRCSNDLNAPTRFNAEKQFSHRMM